MSDKTKFNDAVIKTRTAFELLATARKEFAELGIDVNSFDASGYELYGSPNSVLLTSGINRASVLAEKKIKSIYSDKSYGGVLLDGFYFTQPKIPVEREDRYA